ncbi:Structural maintenance of chromosomes protein 1 [Nosema bombycis CQ1]|uniref:Structural maintenance of chromosomes protein 1 n=1 Tax=Nosema bombycis (strain CQ1 / CVCC 102059) TaxID=578461 RepID=R0M9K7_NOSB1|nr:Structural maintenance of chromosomes protein 1 [Nosema bombycis CQ1]|eukprot:EOB14664.1 Structural maintenance of chromosomes protein 1 [Nosema bombycis CQ1]
MAKIREMTELYKMKDKANSRKKEVNDLLEENQIKIENKKENLEKEKEMLRELEEGYSKIKGIIIGRGGVGEGNDGEGYNGEDEGGYESTLDPNLNLNPLDSNPINNNPLNLNNPNLNNNFTSLESSFLNQTAPLRNQIESLKNQIKEIENSLSKQKSFSKIESEKKLKLEKINSLKKNLKILSQNISVLYEKMGEDLKIYENLEKQEEDKNKKLYEIVGNLLKIRASKKISLKKEIIRNTVQTLKNIFPGVHGILIDLIKPTQKKYSNPLNTILQSYDYSVIVDSSSTAMSCINFIREKKLCKMIFLPLKEIEIKKFNFVLESNYRSALNCITYDKIYENVIQFVFKDTIITDTKEIALELAYKKKINCDICSLENFIIKSKGRVISINKNDKGNDQDDDFNSLIEERKILLNEIKLIQEKKSKM